MEKSKASQALERALGELPKKEKSFDAELFLLKFQKALVDQVGEIKKSIDLFKESQRDQKGLGLENAIALQAMVQNLEQLNKISQKTKKAIEERKIEKVIIEKQAEPREIKVDFLKPNKRDLAQKHGFWTGLIVKAIKDPIDGLISTINDVIERISDAKHPISVRLSNGEEFYQMVTNIISGGGGTSIDASVFTQLIALLTPKTFKTAKIDTSATSTIVTAVGGKRIKVYAIKLNVSAGITVNFRSGNATDLEGGQPYDAKSGYTHAVTPPAFLIATDAGDSLDLVINGVGNVSGVVSYFDDDAT